MKPTLGPWTFDKETGRVIGPDKGAVAFVSGGRMESFENGYLLAAAPELFDVLESALGVIESECGDCEGCKVDPCTQCRAKAVLRRAKGEPS